MKEVKVVKADGSVEVFDPSKLLDSLKRAKVPGHIRNKILYYIEDEVLKDKITTQEIYEKAFKKLKEFKADPAAARYSLKRAVLSIGPSGYPFERYVAGIFKELGYKTETDVVIKGRCVTHEIDVLAEKNGRRIGAELKFHNSLGVKTDVKVALYVKARQDDLKGKLDSLWLITNTRFTLNAIRYGMCAGLNMIGWDYPKGYGIETLIEKAGVYPITVLTSLSEADKNKLLRRNIVMCRQLNKDVLKNAGIFKNVDKILDEAEKVVSGSA